MQYKLWWHMQVRSWNRRYACALGQRVPRQARVRGQGGSGRMRKGNSYGMRRHKDLSNAIHPRASRTVDAEQAQMGQTS